MARTPFQVLVFPYRIVDQDVQFAVFQDAHAGDWQGISGGNEERETPIEVARREAKEEAGLQVGEERFMVLECVNALPFSHANGTHVLNGQRFVMPQYCFGVEVDSEPVHPSDTHAEYRWVGYDEAAAMLASDGSRTALWELYARLQRRVNTAELVYEH